MKELIQTIKDIVVGLLKLIGFTLLLLTTPIVWINSGLKGWLLLPRAPKKKKAPKAKVMSEQPLKYELHNVK